MASGHCVIPPSSAFRRRQCRASAIMELMHPETEESEEAKIGTATHELGAAMIQSFAVGRIGFPEREAVIGKAASNGVLCDDGMYDGALMYAQDVAEIMRTTGVFVPDVEKPVAVPRINDQLWGTPDCTLWHTQGLTLYIHDAKFGHDPVEVFENDQLIEYGVGKLDEITGRNGLADQNIKIVFTIVQPFAFHRHGTVRRWTVTGAELRGYANQLEAIEAEALGPNPMAMAGPACRHCSARRNCDTAIAYAGSLLAYLRRPHSVVWTPETLGAEIRLLQEGDRVLRGLLDGLEAHAEELIRQGTAVAGYALEPGRSSTTWKDKAAAITLGDLLGIDLRKPEAPITPKQAEAKGIDSAVISEYADTVPGSLKLVESTKTAAAAVFSRSKNHVS